MSGPALAPNSFEPAVGDSVPVERVELRAVVLDANAERRRALSDSLAPLVVFAAASAEQALTRLQRAPVDVVIADLHALDRPVADWTAAVRRAGQPASLLLLADADERGAAIAALEAGADDLMLRPADPAELRARLTRLLRATRTRQAELARVREAEERFQHVADNSPWLFWVTDERGECTYLNQRWFEFTGQTPGAALGSGWLDAVHPADRTRARAEFLASNREQRAFRQELRLRRHDDVYRWMIDAGVPRFRDGTFVGFVGSVIDITDEREELDAVTRDRSQLKLALEAGRTGTFDWDIPAGRVTWSPELEALYGMPAGSFSGSFRAWAERVVPEDLTRVDETLRRTFAEHAPEARYEFRAILPSGAHRWLEGRATFVYGPQGKPRRMFGINVDIDEHKRSERTAQVLAELTQSLALLTEPAQIAATTLRKLGTHFAARQALFFSLDETGRPVAADTWSPDAAAGIADAQPLLDAIGDAAFWRMAAQKTVHREDIGGPGEAGADAWLSTPFLREGRCVAVMAHVAAAPKSWTNDEVALAEGVLARVWPLIERARHEQHLKLAEEKIRISEERLRVTLHAARLGTWDVDPKTRDVTWDARCKELFGLPPDATVTWDDFIAGIHPDDRPRVEAAVARALDPASGGGYDIEARVIAPDGVTRWVRGSGKAFFDERGEPRRFMGTVVDISDLVEARETLAERRGELERLVNVRTAKLQETIAELEGFSYSISHDLRAPLRAMQSFAQLLVEDSADQLGPTSRDYLRRIMNASARMDRLIHDVLVYSRVARTELQLAPVDLQTLVDGIVESYPQFQPAAADIIVARDLPKVLGNEAALTQCVSNLLGNAVKFVAPDVRPRVEVRAETNGDRVRLLVTDNGIGIRAAAHEKIFAIFERLSRSYEGTGIGLAVVRKAAERMGGTVSVASVPGQGSTFCLELPRSP